MLNRKMAKPTLNHETVEPTLKRETAELTQGRDDRADALRRNGCTNVRCMRAVKPLPNGESVEPTLNSETVEPMLSGVTAGWSLIRAVVGADALQRDDEVVTEVEVRPEASGAVAVVVEEDRQRSVTPGATTASPVDIKEARARAETQMHDDAARRSGGGCAGRETMHHREGANSYEGA